jgi:hypothetical protein
MTLAREGKQQVWWQPFDLPYATYVGLESAALAVSDFEPGVFPGLLQTPEYARAVHERGLPRLSARVIQQRIEERLTRQQVLVREDPEPLRLTAIVDEAVLRRVVGGPAVMQSQIDHVVHFAERPNITVQVIPFSLGAHAALDSTFIILELAPPVADVVYVEGLVGKIYLERSQEVERYKEVFDHLRIAALSPQDSSEFMATVASQYGNDVTHSPLV